MPENHRAYDRIARQWTAVRNASFVSRLVMDFAAKLPPGARVLDVGCGSGYLSAYLAGEGFDVTGMDRSEQMIALAQSLSLANTDFTQADFFAYAAPQKFGGLLAWDSFFHFPKTRQGEIYQKAAGLLHQSGYLLFTHGDADDEHVDQMMGESFYYTALPKEQVFGLLQKAGFALVYAHTHYREKGTDRHLVVLARKL